jgi:TolA-binding protein
MHRQLLLFAVLLFTLPLDAYTLKKSEIQRGSYALQIATYRHMKSVDEIKILLEDEYLYILQKGGLHTVYVVNIPTYQRALQKQASLQDISKDSIIHPPSNSSPNLITENIDQDREESDDSFGAIMQSTIALKKRPNHRAKTVRILQAGESVVMRIVNKQWCKIVGKEEYFPIYLPQKKPKKLSKRAQQPNKKPTKTDTEKVPLKEYNRALQLFKASKHKEAYAAFEHLFERYPKNTMINFYLGQSAYKLGDLDTASAAYERLLIADPDAQRPKLELALIYFKQNQLDNAEKFFEEVKKANPPKEVLHNIDRFLTAIDQKRQKHFVKGVLIAGASYDSNVNSSPSSDKFDAYMYGVLQELENTTIKASDFAHQETLVLNHLYKYSDDTALKNDFVLYNKGFKKHHNNDIKLISYYPALSVSYGDWSVDYGLFANRIWSDRQLYMNSYGIYPKLKYRLSKTTSLNSSLKYQRTDHLQDDNELQDSEVSEAQIGALFKLAEKLSISPSFTFSKERKDDGELPNIDKDSRHIALTINGEITKDLSLSPKLSFKRTNYKDENPSFLTRQRDNEIKSGLGAMYQFTPGWYAQGAYDYTRVQSNIPIGEYKKHTASINLLRPF